MNEQINDHIFTGMRDLLHLKAGERKQWTYLKEQESVKGCKKKKKKKEQHMEIIQMITTQWMDKENAVYPYKELLFNNRKWNANKTLQHRWIPKTFC